MSGLKSGHINKIKPFQTTWSTSKNHMLCSDTCARNVTKWLFHIISSLIKSRPHQKATLSETFQMVSGKFAGPSVMSDLAVQVCHMWCHVVRSMRDTWHHCCWRFIDSRVDFWDAIGSTYLILVLGWYWIFGRTIRFSSSTAVTMTMGWNDHVANADRWGSVIRPREP